MVTVPLTVSVACMVFACACDAPSATRTTTAKTRTILLYIVSPSANFLICPRFLNSATTQRQCARDAYSALGPSSRGYMTLSESHTLLRYNPDLVTQASLSDIIRRYRMQSHPTPSNVIPNRRYRITVFASFCNPAVPTFLYFSSWYRHSRNFYLEPAYFRVGGDEYRRPIVAAEAQVGCASVTDQNCSQMLTRSIDDPNPAGAGAVHVALDIHLHTIRDARPGTAHLAENAVTMQFEQTRTPSGIDIESANMSPARVIDIKNLFIRRESQSIRHDEIANE